MDLSKRKAENKKIKFITERKEKMKNSFSKIVIFALTLALAACACFAVSVAAAGEEANGPTIISKNMEYGEKFDMKLCDWPLQIWAWSLRFFLMMQ